VRTRLVSALVLALAMATLAVAACRQALGIDDYYGAPASQHDAGGGGGGGADASVDADAEAGVDADASVGADGGACGMTYGAGSCGACAAMNCCTQLWACAGGEAGSPACFAYEACLGACDGGAQCRSECTFGHPLGPSSEVSLLNACLAASCSKECNLECGAVAGYVAEPDTAASCQACLGNNNGACQSARALGTSAEGDAYLRCILTNPTEDLRQLCQARHDAGAALFQAFQSDWVGTCGTDCGRGRNWACVSHVSWPITPLGLVTTSFRIIDFNTKQAVVGATAAVCPGCPCLAGDEPLASGVSDEGGIVELQFQNVASDGLGHGLNGCFHVTGADAGGSPSIAEMYVYWDYPVSVGSNNATDPTDYVQSVTPLELGGLLADFSVPQDATRGNLAVTVKDCLGNTAPGVDLSIDGPDAGVRPFYGSNPSASSPTPDDGTGGFLNVPQGLHIITAQPAGLAQPSSKFQVYVQAGGLTEAQMYPMPP
jgi:hypothetical protein